jgi:hypothetical protein
VSWQAIVATAVDSCNENSCGGGIQTFAVGTVGDGGGRFFIYYLYTIFEIICIAFFCMGQGFCKLLILLNQGLLSKIQGMA